MSALSASFVQLFTTFITIFSAINRFALGLDNIGKVVEESSAAYADEARIQRQAKLNLMLKQERITEKQLNAIK
jgi:CBS domain containing-hemolysin-like protein